MQLHLLRIVCAIGIDDILLLSSIISLSRLNLPVRWHFDPSPMQIIALHSIEATKDEEPLVVQNYRLVERARGKRDIERNASSPGL